jgi:hypothetical protein
MRILYLAAVLLLLIGAAPYGQNPLPVDAASPVTLSVAHPVTQTPLSTNGLCSGYSWGGLPATYWELPPWGVRAPDDPDNLHPGLWEANTDSGGWQPILPEALVTKSYGFGFIVYVKEQRGAVHVGCFSPG